MLYRGFTALFMNKKNFPLKNHYRDINENFFIDARYSLEVTNRIGDLPGLPDNISGKINSLQIGVGYKF